ncbi:hypothetical protein B0H21DRAFT_883770 [Amylocystis lapponica]|nr:hypothetical protein B0H21DRAFT_883770 [Amylocystis lapponica]
MLVTKSLKRVSRSFSRAPPNGLPPSETFLLTAQHTNASSVLPQRLHYSRDLSHATHNPHSKPVTPRLCHGRMRTYSTDTPISKSGSSDSIFSSEEDPWDRVFEDIQDMPPLLPSSVRHSERGSRTSASQGTPRRRRYEMTLREASAFDTMFDMIFDTADKTGRSKLNTLTSTMGGIGVTHSTGGDLFGQLHRQSRRLKWTTEADQELDRKREEVELCDTDQQLLEWALREVFAESERYEALARRAPDAPARALLQPPAYPHLLALLMRTFRDRYADPHLALAVFDHARNRSIPSFVFGCTTPAYNELVETRWRCFRDLRGVCDALEEMRVNGVETDNRTRALAEMIRREVGERNLWQEESTMGSGEVWEMVDRIERLTAREVRRQVRDENTGTRRALNSRKWTSDQETWKSRALQGDNAKDGWEFGQWGEPESDRRSSRSESFGLR